MMLTGFQSAIIFTEWAKELGGITATLEHRYFGQSLPFGNDSYTLDNLKHFTLENVMLDAVNFVDFIKKNVTGAANSKAIVAGGMQLTSPCSGRRSAHNCPQVRMVAS